MADLPSHASVVIIGGGAVGCSTAYHLGKMGVKDVVLLEKNELTAGSSWHAAGNCPNHAGSWSIMKMQSYSTALYRKLGDEVDYPMNYHVTGAVRLAHSKERMQEFERIAAMAQYQGMEEFRTLTLDELKEHYPVIETHDLVGAAWDPLDGDIDPAQLTQALARGARQNGVNVIRFCPVEGVSREGDLWVLKTPQGEIRCEKVVNAAGYYAQRIWDMFRPYSAYPDRHMPAATLAHQYLITEPIEELTTRETPLPLLRDPDSSYYLRQEKDGLLLGPYEYKCRAHWVDESDPVPDDFSFQLYPDDLDRLEWYIEDACARVPLLGTVGVSRVVNGPIPYAPDGNPLIGPMPGVPNAFEACVFTFGIVQGGGAGKIAAEWINYGEPEWDMWSCDPRRYTGFADHDFAVKKAIEVYSHEYGMHFPHYEWPAGRNKRPSPLHDKLKSLGARFGARAGHERAVWFGDGEDDGSWLEAAQTWERAGPWFKAVAAECEAIHERAGLCDLPGFSRYRVEGDGAVDWIRTVVTGAIPRVGRIGLVYFADDQGRILTEMSLVRDEEDAFTLISGAGAEWHDLDWLRRHLPDGTSISVTNVSTQSHCLVVSGPKTRDILSGLVNVDLSNDTFPWLTHRRALIAGKEVQLIRVSYVGELGWEIHCDPADAPAIFDAVYQAGKPHGLALFGMYAMESMRIEKGYRSWKLDLSTDFNMISGGLDRFIKWEKPTFVGKAALERIRQEGSPDRFAILTVDANGADAPYLSTIWQNGKRVGLTTSGNWGHRTQKSIALSVIDKDAAEPGTELEVEIYGERRKAIVEAAPHFDPENERLRA